MTSKPTIWTVPYRYRRRAQEVLPTMSDEHWDMFLEWARGYEEVRQTRKLSPSRAAMAPRRKNTARKVPNVACDHR